MFGFVRRFSGSSHSDPFIASFGPDSLVTVTSPPATEHFRLHPASASIRFVVDGPVMVEYLVKRLLVVLALSLLLRLALAPVEDRLSSASRALYDQGLLEHRRSYTVEDIYFVLDELEMSYGMTYLAYQFVRPVVFSVLFSPTPPPGRSRSHAPHLPGASRRADVRSAPRLAAALVPGRAALLPLGAAPRGEVLPRRPHRHLARPLPGARLSRCGTFSLPPFACLLSSTARAWPRQCSPSCPFSWSPRLSRSSRRAASAPLRRAMAPRETERTSLS